MFHGLLWGCFLAALLLLLLGSLLPSGIPLLALPVAPPVKHVIGYSVLAILMVLAMRADVRRSAGIALGLTALGLVVELAQIPVPVRSFLWLDVGACALGAVLGSVVGLGLRRFAAVIRRPKVGDRM